MKKAKFFTLVSAVFLFCSYISAEYKPIAEPPAAPQIFPLSEIREGMRASAKTVFRGNTSEGFSVEILGVLPNWIGPRQDLIVGKLSGANAERTFVFAGMSGSPVYIDGRLVGAISYSFPFSKEPICGITPIEQMISVVETGPAPLNAGRTPAAFSYAELLSNTWRPSVMAEPVSRGPLATGFAQDSRLMAVAGQTFTPIATPITIAGISQATIDGFAQEWMRAGLIPVAASVGGDSSAAAKLKPATETTLQGGDSVVVHLSRGDIMIAAAGTVTMRDGDKIYGFGHPFFSLGATSMPMSESHVITVVPNANNSFKMAVADAPVGAMTQDRATGIYGLLGESAKMLPVKIRVKTSRGRDEEVNFESAVDELLTPLIVNAGVGNSLSAHERGLGDSTIEFNAEITVKGEQPILIKRRFAGGQASAFAASAAVVPLAVLLRAGFDGTEVTAVNVNMTVVDGAKTAVIDRISLDRTQVRAGETVQAKIMTRNEAGQIVERSFPVTIPTDTAPGPLNVTIGDGNAVQQNTAITKFIPKTAAELINTINHLKRPDRLYAMLSRTSTGLIVGSSEMPNLPPSVLATMNNDRTAGGSKPSVQSILSYQEIPDWEYIVTGQQTLTVEVVR